MKRNLIETEYSLAKQLIQNLDSKGLSMSTAESCTGGRIASAITAISGSSDVFGYGIVSYSNKAKIQLLGVDEASLKTFGAVSEQVVREMVQGVAKLSSSEVAIAVSGIAGPKSNEIDKPVGLIYLATLVQQKIEIKKLLLTGSRNQIQNQTVIEALNSILKRL